MFQALLCPSSWARDCDVDYHIGRFVLGFLEAGVVSGLQPQAQLKLCLSLQPGHYSSLTAPNLQSTANQERIDQCGKQHHIRELLMMDIVMVETCWAYKKYNKISSGI